MDKVDGYIALIGKLDDYILFLEGCSKGPASLAYAHGWRCTQKVVDEGVRLRKEICELREYIAEREVGKGG